uniref:ATP synthase subunit a n=1 Tax=Navis striatus TaxID=1580118 RepID=A0A1P8AG77_9ACAR|nr:ATP synthase F0 subunit 6 [Navis striatus]
MMNNLFSIFDPSTSLNFSTNWISCLIIFLCLPLIFWTIPSRLQLFWLKITKYFVNELLNIFKKTNKKFILIFASFFWFILASNFMGLFPYIFTPTSHINLTSLLALTFWLTLMLFGWINLTKLMFSHLVPMSTPIFLAPFMVIIETISNLIRPITLSVRLSANMISGHLLICLLSSTLQNFMIFPMITPILITLMILESAVAIIQSYVFVTLATLYLNEIN